MPSIAIVCMELPMAATHHMNNHTKIQSEVLSDGSKVYNVHICSDLRFPEESTATFFCTNEAAAIKFACAVDAAVANYAA